MHGSTSRVVSEASAEALEFPSFLALAAELAATDAGRLRLLSLRPSVSRDELARRHQRVREIERLLEEGSLVPGDEEPLLPLLAAIRDREGSITGSQLMELAGILRITHQAKERVRSSQEALPSLEALVSELPDAQPLRRLITKSLDRRGRVRDDASPLLVDLRRRVQRIRESLYKDLREAIERHKDHFTETTVSLKDGRLTLLLQAGSRGRLEGLVHGRSATGQSLYFEPSAVVEANNVLQESIEEEEEERRRIVAALVQEVREQRSLIEAHFDVLGELDMLQGVCRFAAISGSSLPEIGTASELRLVQARHPLLDPGLASLRQAALGQPGHVKPVVPMNLELGASRRVLVITGPNAGGKTVALKTVGLLSLVAQCGLPVPAESGTRLPLFTDVTAVVGDEQDLLADQSTFSARLLRLKEAWEVAGPRSLILVDELGAGTDPEEGAALAVALLEELLASGTLAVLTTHTTQLAAVALEREAAACAAMEFDPASGAPTYHLRPGAPGGSQALALAERLGLPEPWLRRAEELLGSEHRDLRKLLREVEAVRQELATARARAQSEVRALERERRLMDEELAALQEERRRLAARVRGELEAFRRKVNERLRDEFEAMRKEVASGRRKGVVAAGVERLFEGAPSIAEEEEASEGSVEVDGRVRHRTFGWQGRLEKVRGNQAQVVVQGKRVRCALADLAAVRENSVERPRRPTVEVSRVETDADEVGAELDLLGHRVEPALEALDRYLDQAMLSSLGEVRVIHGHGSGRLRAAVREHLGRHPAVAGFRPGKRGEGGEGATVVILNKA